MMSKETLISQARKFDYKPENYEKVYKLLFVLEQFMSVPYLKDRLVLKGGTALIEQQRAPTQHAGGKNVWKYDSALGQKGNLEIDLNYMFRNPLWPIIELESKLSFSNSLKVPVLDIHELASGKLSALFARKVSRDFFDAHYLLTKCNLSKSKLRETFVVYAAFSTSLVEDVSISL